MATVRDTWSSSDPSARGTSPVSHDEWQSVASWGEPRTRRLAKLALDTSVIVAAIALAYCIRFEQFPRGTYGLQLGLLLLCLPLLRVLGHRSMGVYRQSWRLFGLREALHLVAATAGVSSLLLLARIAMPHLLPQIVTVPYSIVAFEGLLSLVFLMGLRVCARLVDEGLSRRHAHAGLGEAPRRAVLVGAGRAGRMAARELRNRPDAGYDVVAFLDDDPARRGQVIEGVPVMGATDNAASVADSTDADCFILTMPSASRTRRRAAVERCRAAGLEVRTVPGFYELLGGKVGITKIRPVRIEDLLGRDVVDLDPSAWATIRAAFAGKRIVVTGAGGSIGSELCRQIAELEPERLILFENNENNLFDIEAELKPKLGDRLVACLADVRDPEQVAAVFDDHAPQVVFHAAAFKHVPMMEHHPWAAIGNNVLGTQVLTDAADAYGVERFLFVSTDKAVNPANVMGASKRMAELIVQAADSRSSTRFCCVRFGNVLGSRGSVLHTFQRQIEAGGPVTVTHPDVTRFFMTIPEAVRLVIQSAGIGEGGEVFLLDMGEPVRILDLAISMIQLAGLSTEEIPIEIVGLRPGEKLYEELLRDEEGKEECRVEGIFLANLATVDPQVLGRWVGLLRDAAEIRDTAAIRRLLVLAAGYRPDPQAAPVVETQPRAPAQLRVAG